MEVILKVPPQAHFHVMSFQNSKLKSHESFILSWHKDIYIYICLQLFSPIACWVWKPSQFEVQSYSSG